MADARKSTTALVLEAVQDLHAQDQIVARETLAYKAAHAMTRCSSARLERQVHTLKVVGSKPTIAIGTNPGTWRQPWRRSGGKPLHDYPLRIPRGFRVG